MNKLVIPLHGLSVMMIRRSLPVVVRRGTVAIRTFIRVLTALPAVAVPLAAQCAMCKSSVETTDNAAFVAALRDGIYLLLITPYLIAAAIAVGVYVHWRKRARSRQVMRSQSHLPRPLPN